MSVYASKHHNVTTCPEVLLIQLLRWGARGRVIDHRVDINPVLEFGGYAYHLCSVVFHRGRSATEGHYVCYTKNPSTNAWWHYDDMKKPGCQARATLEDQGKAYLLFYERGDGDAQRQADGASSLLDVQ